MSAVEFVAANRNRALAHESGMRVEFSRLQQRQQGEGFDAGAGMHHATSGYIEMVSREDVSRLDIDDYGGATAARPCARNRCLQRQMPCPCCYSGQCREAQNDRGEASAGQVQAGHASIVMAQCKRGGMCIRDEPRRTLLAGPPTGASALLYPGGAPLQRCT